MRASARGPMAANVLAPSVWVTVVSWALGALAVYLALGVLFAVPFVLRWVGRIDPDAAAGSAGFRALIFPGAVALWPLLLRRLRQGAAALPVERTPHRRAARVRP